MDEHLKPLVEDHRLMEQTLQEVKSTVDTLVVKVDFLVKSVEEEKRSHKREIEEVKTLCKAEIEAAWEYAKSLSQRVKILESKSDKMDGSFTTLKFLGGLIVGIIILLECIAIWLSIG